MNQESLRYTIVRPTVKKDRFTLTCFVLEARSKKTYHPLSEKIQKQVLKINEQYKSKLLSQIEAESLLKDLILNEYKRLGLKHIVLKNSLISEINQKIFNQFWDKEYSNRYLTDEDSPKHDILKALRLIEPLSIQTATQTQLQNALKKSGASASEIRRASDRLNQLLRFLGRDFKLNKPKPEFKRVQYINFEDFNKMILFIENQNLKDFAVTLFSSGLRLSEALALAPQDLFNNGYLNVDKQLTKDGSVKEPKRGSKGKVLIIPFGLDAVKRFVKIKNKEELRFKLYNALEVACQKAFPDDKDLWVGPHDLRHSHAIHLLSKGANLGLVAMNLRNRIDVCQKYYTGFEHSNDTLEGLKKFI